MRASSAATSIAAATGAYPHYEPAFFERLAADSAGYGAPLKFPVHRSPELAAHPVNRRGAARTSSTSIGDWELAPNWPNGVDHARRIASYDEGADDPTRASNCDGGSVYRMHFRQTLSPGRFERAQGSAPTTSANLQAGRLCHAYQFL